MKIDPWRTLTRRSVLETPIFEVGSASRQHPDRDTPSEFWWVSPPDWVNVVALTPEGEVVLVRQYRHGADAVTLEIPGGQLDAGEEPLVAAARELREETGFVCDSLEVIGAIEVNPAFMTNRCTTVLGRGARQTADQEFDEHEELAVELKSVGAFFEAIDSGEIDHGIVVSAAYFLTRALGR